MDSTRLHFPLSADVAIQAAHAMPCQMSVYKGAQHEWHAMGLRIMGDRVDMRVIRDAFAVASPCLLLYLFAFPCHCIYATSLSLHYSTSEGGREAEEGRAG